MKYNVKQLQLILGTILLGLMATVTAILFIEYRFFKEHSQRLLEVRDEYREYVLALKNMVDEYNKQKEQQESNDEKKNDIVRQRQSIFPEGVRVYSSDDAKVADAAFTPLNRELPYLKESALTHLKEHDLGVLCEHLEKEFVEYSDQITRQPRMQGSTKNKQRIKRTRTPRVRRSPQQRISYPRNIPFNDKEHRDMSFAWPIERQRFWLSSGFGPRRKSNRTWGFHQGIDMASVKGTPVKAAYDGVVTEARVGSGYGNMVVIAHNQKYKTLYAHLHKICVYPGQRVKKGHVVGLVGDTGLVRKVGRDASHLHFEVHVFGRRMNPLYFLHEDN